LQARRVLLRGEIIDLCEGENAIVIEELAEQCTIIDEKIATHV
jgi:hypothetical protein